MQSVASFHALVYTAGFFLTPLHQILVKGYLYKYKEIKNRMVPIHSILVEFDNVYLSLMKCGSGLVTGNLRRLSVVPGTGLVIAFATRSTARI